MHRCLFYQLKKKMRHSFKALNNHDSARRTLSLPVEKEASAEAVREEKKNKLKLH